MLDLLTFLDRRAAARRARRRWEKIQPLLILVLLCVLCQVFSAICGLTGYVLQYLGLLPTVTPTPGL